MCELKTAHDWQEEKEVQKKFFFSKINIINRD